MKGLACRDRFDLGAALSLMVVDGEEVEATGPLSAITFLSRLEDCKVVSIERIAFSYGDYSYDSILEEDHGKWDSCINSYGYCGISGYNTSFAHNVHTLRIGFWLGTNTSR